MSYFCTTTAHSTTGVKTITCGFQPTGMRITAGHEFGVSETCAHQSTGVSDGVDQFFNTFYQDTTGGKTEDGDTKIVSLYDRVSGNITEVVAASFDSFTATQGKYNVTTADVDYNLMVELWN